MPPITHTEWTGEPGRRHLVGVVRPPVVPPVVQSSWFTAGPSFARDAGSAGGVRGRRPPGHGCAVIPLLPPRRVGTTESGGVVDVPGATRREVMRALKG